MRTNVIVTLQVEGTDNWPDVIRDHSLKHVQFLQHSHRHMFHLVCKSYVNHADRDKEIINLKQNILAYLKESWYIESSRLHEFGSSSCEMLAQEVLCHFELEYCSCLEDNENGAEVYCE